MIICKMCGNNNPDDSAFCGDCGKFLEWTGEKVVVPETITVVEEPEQEQQERPKRWWRRLMLRMRSTVPSYTIEPRRTSGDDGSLVGELLGEQPQPPRRKWPLRRRRKPAYEVVSEPAPVSNRSEELIAVGVAAAAAASRAVTAETVGRHRADDRAPSSVAVADPVPARAVAAAVPPTASAPPVPGGSTPPTASAPPVPGGPKPPIASAPPVPGGPKPPTPGGARPPVPGGARPPVPGGATPPVPAGAVPPTPGAGAKPPTPGGAKPPTPGGAKPPAPGGSKPPAVMAPGAKAVEEQPAEDPQAAAEDAAAAAAKAELVAALVTPVEGHGVLPDYDTPEVAPQPVLQKVRPIVKTKPSRRLEPGDLVCAVCGEGNPPSRRFCSRCGESLDEAGVVTAVWWRRFFAWVASVFRRAPFPAGTRPGQKGTREHRRGVFMATMRKIRYVLAGILVTLGLVYTFYPPFRATVHDDVLSIFRAAEITLKPVHPVRVDVNIQTPQHPGTAAADEYTDTYWLASWSESQRPTMKFQFGSAGLLRSLILRSGAPDDFVKHGRPSILKVTFSTGRVETLTPQDTSGAQTLTLSNTAFVDWVTVEVVDIYSGEGTGANDVAITEMEWFNLK